MAALVMVHAISGTAIACGAAYRIDRASLTRAAGQTGQAKSVTWTLGKAQPIGTNDTKAEMLAGSWIRFANDGRWSGRIGVRNGFRVRPATFRLSFGFALHGDGRSGLLPTVRSEPLTVSKQTTRWIEIGGTRGPEGVIFDIVAKGNAKPVWSIICAPGA
jgi:hypothetical protein